MRNYIFLSLIWVLLSSSFPVSAKNTPYVWNIEHLKQVKSNPDKYPIYDRILKAADSYARATVPVVTNKKKQILEDRHYYVSMSTYYWPDEKNPNGEYVCIDGKKNPDVADYDLTTIDLFGTYSKCLAVAYYLSGQQKYYDAFMKYIKAFFLDDETFMYPNMQYAQIVRGRKQLNGTSPGLVETQYLLPVLEAIKLVNDCKPIEQKTLKGLQDWFSEFIDWMLTSDLGVLQKQNKGNIAIMYDIFLEDCALFVGNKALAKKIVSDFEETRLKVQIKEDGSQPTELRRATAFTYSLKSLGYIIDFCHLNEGTKYYKKHKKIIDSAFLYLQQYIGHQEKFPYKQETSWDDCEKGYYSHVARLEYLAPRHNKSYNFNSIDKEACYSSLTQLLY